ncbi:MAG TPA: thioredoxin domain-containing protein [Pyrinomonadaceae bacterium]|nr:thioredoxin domain-containing protein [Pyrinomonadaceae bacterium]HQY68267.1 thioredoxin domain-containing protein [Pyrinomonadaceae bacterium]HRA41316.1 thioredoxin domain-containing protein [Pyrinomonadaceae bacterium]
MGMDNSHKFTNHLITETSPYLLQHAHNPVDWYPWGDEAFAKASAEDKPVLVSIGYSACHWCHVMEHESFEDEATAAIMNEHFVNIKVDMEERPDVDQIYMSFVQMTTGRGGWPMNVFITPDKRPFYGGTYFPPAPRYGMPSWRQILKGIADTYRNKREDLIESADRIVGELKKMSVVEAATGTLSTEMLDSAFTSFTQTFDAVNGGFGGAPKFPAAMSLEFLLQYYHRTGDDKALSIVTFTLEKMARGGIYDQLGGGFHRYAVDAIWLVPHFEKMLYDNAQLIRVYLHAYQLTGEEFFKRIATECLEYIKREMLDESGGFYSTQDADSEGVEGKFFVWEPEEIKQILGDDAGAEFCAYFDVSKNGNFEGENILNVKTLGTSPSDCVREGIHKLFAAREQRIKPFRDEKVLTAWNGLMLGAFADAAGVLGNKEYLQIARSNAEFIKRELSRDGRLLRTWKDGTAKLNGYIEDYANVADGLIELFQVSGEFEHLIEAQRLTDLMITEFWDADNGGFFFTSNDHEELVVRNKDFYDNATPSGNSVAADVLLKLAKLTGDAKYERFAITVLRLAASQIRRHPQGFGRSLSALEFHLAETKEIVVVGETGNELERAILAKYRPDSVVLLDNGNAPAEIPLLTDRPKVDGKATLYVCRNFVCSRPVTDIAELDAVING